VTVSPQPYEVIQLVVRTFREFGGDVREAWDVDQTILVGGGSYRGRSYRADGLMAMWLIDVGIIQFYSAEGDMLRTVNLFERVEAQRIAA